MHGDDVRKLDLWTGGIMESTSEGPGELFTHIILDQFSRIRDGDRFWFENQANGYVAPTILDDKSSIHQDSYVHTLHHVQPRCGSIVHLANINI